MNPRQNFCLKVWGDFASFNRPELKIERVTYDVITPSAARAIFSAIFWKPAILWHVVKIEVLNPIRTISIRKNEVAALASKGKKEVFIEDARQQKSSTCLRDVAYRIYADMEFLPPEQRKKDVPHPEEGPEVPGKYYAIFERRAAKGQTFHQPYLGTREYPAYFKYIPQNELQQERETCPPLSSEHDRDFGIMLYDMDFSDPSNLQAMFFRASMKNGTILVPEQDSPEVLR